MKSARAGRLLCFSSAALMRSEGSVSAARAGGDMSGGRLVCRPASSGGRRRGGNKFTLNSYWL